MSTKLDELRALAAEVQAQRYGFSAEPIKRPAIPTIIEVPNPAAGADFSYKIRGEFAFMPEIIHYKLATSAVVANRGRHIQYLTPDGILAADFTDGGGAGAGTTIDFTYADRMGIDHTGASFVTVTLVGYPLPPGWTIRSLTPALDVGDKMTNIQMFGYRYSTGDDEPLERETFGTAP